MLTARQQIPLVGLRSAPGFEVEYVYGYIERFISNQNRRSRRKMPKCEIYKDVKGEWRWRLTTKKGDIKAHATEGFETREECEKDGKENGCTSYKRT